MAKDKVEVLYKMFSYTTEQIATELNLSEDTVKEIMLYL